jgi:hypothetical protein
MTGAEQRNYITVSTHITYLSKERMRTGTGSLKPIQKFVMGYIDKELRATSLGLASVWPWTGFKPHCLSVDEAHPLAEASSFQRLFGHEDFELPALYVFVQVQYLYIMEK